MQSVTEVSLIFRDYGYISATDFKIFYNDTGILPEIDTTSSGNIQVFETFLKSIAKNNIEVRKT